MSQFRNPRWSETDMEACRADWEAGVPMDTLIERYRRTRSAIECKASQLKWKSRRGRQIKFWTGAEMKRLKDDYLDLRLPWDELKAKYGRTDGSLSNQLSRMGIRRQREAA